MWTGVKNALLSPLPVVAIGLALAMVGVLCLMGVI
jgi:hypothetical protein